MNIAYRSLSDPTYPTGPDIEAFKVEPTVLGMRILCAIGASPAFSRLVIRYRSDGAVPETPGDGCPLLDIPVTPGASYHGCHHPLFRGFDFIYTLFGLDESGMIRVRATIVGAPSAG